jgi:hypothetical protein
MRISELECFFDVEEPPPHVVEFDEVAAVDLLFQFLDASLVFYV